MISERFIKTIGSRGIYALILCIILSAASINIFLNLGSVPIDSWDEARHGASAYEMLIRNNFIVNTFAFNTDYWNLKPPLSFWVISLGYKIAGFNPFGLRLFSALAAMLAIVSITLYSRYRYGRLASVISAAVLTTTTQYILSHSARTGDADSLYVFFFTLSMISLAMVDNSRKWLYISGICFSMAFLTKSWHSINIAAIIFLYVIFSGHILKAKPRTWIYLLFSSSASIVVWGVFRYSQDGFTFIKNMIDYDLLARSSRTLEGHTGDSSYYLLTLQYGYRFWALILLAAFALFLYKYVGKGSKKLRNSELLLILWIALPLLFYSIAKTKITWYLLPVFPAMAIAIGAMSSRLILDSRRFSILKLALAASILLTSVNYEKNIINEITKIKTDSIQSTFQQFGNVVNTSHANIYTMDINKDYPACWKQCDLLAAELYGQMIPRDGGIDAFLTDSENSFIIVPNSKEYKTMIKEKSLKIVYSDGVNLILSH